VRGSAPADGSPELDDDVVPALGAVTVPVLEEDEATGELDPCVTGVDELEEPEGPALDELDPEELAPEEVDPEEVEPEEVEPEEVEPDEPELGELGPEPFDPPSGSTYCWSPADVPLASAAAGPTRTSAERTQSQLSVMRAERTPRVLQGVRPLASEACSGAARQWAPAATSRALVPAFRVPPEANR
jgi:hypothetical protein